MHQLLTSLCLKRDARPLPRTLLVANCTLHNDVVLQGFSAADLPHVELTSSRGGRSSLFRASAARFFELRQEVSIKPVASIVHHHAAHCFRYGPAACLLSR